MHQNNISFYSWRTHRSSSVKRFLTGRITRIIVAGNLFGRPAGHITTHDEEFRSTGRRFAMRPDARMQTAGTHRNAATRKNGIRPATGRFANTGLETANYGYRNENRNDVAGKYCDYNYLCPQVSE